MSNGLSVNSIVSVNIVLSPQAAGLRNFGALLMLGTTAVIDVTERFRTYASITEVANDFGTSVPEYLAARNFFSQNPRPSTLQIGRWAKTATAGLLRGGALSAAQQLLSNFTAIVSGAMTFTVDGVSKPLTAINLSGAANLNAVASIITAASTGYVVTWNASRNRFDITSSTTGASSTVTAPAATPLATAMGLTAVAGATPVAGIVAETAAAAAALFADLSNDWYGLMFAAPLTAETDILPVAAFIEAASPARILGHTTQDVNTLVAAATSDVAYQLAQLLYKRTYTQYSSTDPYAVASPLGRAFTVNFTGNRTALTLKFKQMPGVVSELLSTSQALAAAAKRANVFVKFDNGTSILKEGTMASGDFFDIIHGTDWLADAVQNNCYNLLYTSTTKLPQTEEGQTALINACEAVLALSVTNGLVAPGIWNADGFGQLARGDRLDKGFYVYSAPVDQQLQAEREARKAQPIQIAVKLAGAIHSADVTINVNR